METNNNEAMNIDFNKLLQESRELTEMLNKNDFLALKVNEILKALTHTIQLEVEKLEEVTKSANDYKNKYEELEKKYNNLKHEYDELEKDYDLVYNANQRKSELLQAIRDNDDD